MFTIADRAGLVPSRLAFPTVKVRSTRKCFFEESELASPSGAPNGTQSALSTINDLLWDHIP